MKRKFLAAAVLGVMVSVTPAGAYAASTETSSLPVNSESDAAVQSEEKEVTTTPAATPEATPGVIPDASPAPDENPSETPATTPDPSETPGTNPSETPAPAESTLKEGWNSVE